MWLYVQMQQATMLQKYEYTRENVSFKHQLTLTDHLTFFQYYFLILRRDNDLKT